MSKNNDFVFKALHIVAWVIFIGLCVEAGGLIVNFVFSLFKPDFVGNLYQKLDLSQLYEQSKWSFFGMYSFLISIALLKALLFYMLILLQYKMDLAKPFNADASRRMNQIAYFTFSIGLISFIARGATINLLRHGYEIDKLNRFWVDSQAFILMAAVVYVIAQIYQRGVELQNENDLTV